MIALHHEQPPQDLRGQGRRRELERAPPASTSASAARCQHPLRGRARAVVPARHRRPRHHRRGGGPLPHRLARLAPGRRRAGPSSRPPNTVTVANNGPLYLRGDLQIDGAGEGMPGVRLRAALRRCGQSKNKPFCDNSHEGRRLRRSWGGRCHRRRRRATPGPLVVKGAPNGPLLLSGDLRSGRRRAASPGGTRAALCRCGHPRTSPSATGCTRPSASLAVVAPTGPPVPGNPRDHRLALGSRSAPTVAHGRHIHHPARGAAGSASTRCSATSTGLPGRVPMIHQASPAGSPTSTLRFRVAGIGEVRRRAAITEERGRWMELRHKDGEPRGLRIRPTRAHRR